jgi:hypothetical protein
MATVVCPFCYQRIDPSQLWYQCLGRNGTCEKAVDPQRLRLTKSTLETFPSFTFEQPVRSNVYAAYEGFPSFTPVRADRGNSCPSCGGQTNLRACPACHTALPVHFRDSAIFCLVGSRGSGKTVLMTVLAKELRGAIGRRFQADVSLATENPDGLAGESDYKAKRENALYRDGELPPPTELLGTGARQHSASVLLRWRRETLDSAGQPTTASTMLSFVDSAGEQGNSLMAAFALDYLEVCGGIIVVLDPFALPGARATLSLPSAAVSVDDEAPLDVLRTITEKLQIELALAEGQKIAIPAAVVFTKIDAFFTELDRLHSPLMTAAPDQPSYSEEDGERVHENVRSLLYQWDAQDIDAHIRMNYADYRYFGVSALGAEPDYQDHKVDPGGIRPHRVGDPALWLLSKKGTVERA